MSRWRSLAVGVIGGLLACSKSPPPSPPPARAHDAAPVTTGPPTGESAQLVTAIVGDWDSTEAEISLWVGGPAAWRRVLGPWPAVVGAKGTAWGLGEHGQGAPAGRPGPVKREGDGKSPAGRFTMRRAFGYAPRAQTHLAYTPVDDHWRCVDDPESKHYTKILDERGVAKDWSSAEDMRRRDELYRWVVEVDHNQAAVPGGGSCIFLHVWSGPRSATAGCTAMDEAHLTELLATVDASARFVLLPRAEYDALASSWQLPR